MQTTITDIDSWEEVTIEIPNECPDTNCGVSFTDENQQNLVEETYMASEQSCHISQGEKPEDDELEPGDLIKDFPEANYTTGYICRLCRGQAYTEVSRKKIEKQ
jgi:hypothetical protein